MMHDIFKDALKPFTIHISADGSRPAEKVTPTSELAARWIAEARRHEHAADEHSEFNEDEERLLHLEIARVLRNCARELEGV